MDWIRRLLFGTFLLAAVCTPLYAADNTQLEGVELQAMADTFQYSLENNPTNQASDWVNPDTKRSGAVVPVKTFENAQGQPCREFVTTIVIADKEEQGYGTACRQPDGSWQLVSREDDSSTNAPVVQTPASTRNYRTPSDYYAYPSGFYGPYPIYLSFNYVYRSGRLHRGHYYLKARDFRYRYPFRVKSHVYVGPRIFKRHRIYDELRYRDWERKQRIRKHEKKEGKRWRKEKWEDRRDRRHDRRDDDHKRRRGKKHDD